MSPSWRKRAAFLVVLGVLALAWATLFPAWPDDWDGLGFLASIARFDLASFAPHPPGYPVYVACLKLAACVTSSASSAARLIAVASGVVTFLAVWLALPEPETGAWSRALAAAAVCATPLAFHALSGVGSEGTALACAAMALAGLASAETVLTPRRRAWVVGLAVGLGLGVRLSWAPFYVPFLLLLPRYRMRASLVAVAASVAWAVPLVLLTGPAKLALLYRTQAGGHFGRWGGTALTDPVRVRFLVRDVLADGVGAGRDALGVLILVALGCALAVSLVVSIRTPTAARPRAALRVTLLVAPYLVWVTLGQNLREQPRHALPLVFLLSYGLARAFLLAPSALRPFFATLALLVGVRATLDAVARKTIPPDGAQLLAYLRNAAPLATTAVFTGASGRFLEGTEWQPRAHPAGSLGDALLAVNHLSSMPRPLLLTSELTALDEAPAPLSLVATFCRPARIDRRTTCLQVYEIDAKAALMR